MLELKAISQASEIPEDTVHTIGSELSGRPRGLRYTAVCFLIYKVITDDQMMTNYLQGTQSSHMCLCLCGVMHHLSISLLKYVYFFVSFL